MEEKNNKPTQPQLCKQDLIDVVKSIDIASIIKEELNKEKEKEERKNSETIIYMGTKYTPEEFSNMVKEQFGDHSDYKYEE